MKKISLNITAEKITVIIPHDLKEKLVSIKDELKTSMSAIYKEALEAYLEKKELGNADGKIYEY